MKQVVFIMVDTQRKDMLTAYDKDSVPTPKLEELSHNSKVYTNGFTCQPVCGPARSAIFTGLYPHSNGMVSNCEMLGANIKNAGEWISPHGVECAYIGKWHLDGGDYFGYGKCPNGYNPKYWYDMRNFLDEMSDKDRLLSRKDMNLRFDDPDENSTYAHKCADKAIAFMNEFKDKDFFLTLSLDEPHGPSVCPRKYVTALKKYKFHRLPNTKASLADKPEHQKVWAKQYKRVHFWAYRKAMKGMLACNCYCDYEIGRVLDEIKALGLSPMIVYTSDHGDMFLSHSIIGKGCVMYNEVTNVPFMISGGGFKNGVDSTPVSHIDLLPTVMTYLGINPPPMLQGEPLQEVKENAKRDIFIEFTRYETDHDSFMGFQPIRCIFDGRYKLVINLLSSDELYDLQNDKYEKVNLINDKSTAKIRNELHDRLIDKMNTTRDYHRGYYWHCRSWRPEIKPSYHHTGYTRQLVEDDFVQCDYNTGLPMKSSTRKKTNR